MPRHPVPLREDQIEMRSVMMRLYHSHFLGEGSYPARFVNGSAPALEAIGWIEAVGADWRITERGIEAWAEMNRDSLRHQWAANAPIFKELRAYLKKK